MTALRDSRLTDLEVENTRLGEFGMPPAVPSRSSAKKDRNSRRGTGSGFDLRVQRENDFDPGAEADQITVEPGQRMTAGESVIGVLRASRLPETSGERPKSERSSKLPPHRVEPSRPGSPRLIRSRRSPTARGALGVDDMAAVAHDRYRARRHPLDEAVRSHVSCDDASGSYQRPSVDAGAGEDDGARPERSTVLDHDSIQRPVAGAFHGVIRIHGSRVAVVQENHAGPDEDAISDLAALGNLRRIRDLAIRAYRDSLVDEDARADTCPRPDTRPGTDPAVVPDAHAVLEHGALFDARARVDEGGHQRPRAIGAAKR